MDKNTSKNQNRSMFLYTALIFAVALLLIIIAFFGQTKKQKVEDIVETSATEQITPESTASPTEQTKNEEAATNPPEQDEFAKLSNRVLSLDNENNELKDKIAVYEQLLAANKSVSENDIETANATLAEINADSLTAEQKILYDQITAKINE